MYSLDVLENKKRHDLKKFILYPTSQFIVGADRLKIAMKEIEEAMKQIRPQVDEFMKNVKEGDKIAGSSQSISDLSNKIKQMLPDAKDLDHKNFINDNMLKMFDELLAKNDANKNLLSATKRLFDTLLDESKKVSYYA